MKKLLCFSLTLAMVAGVTFAQKTPTIQHKNYLAVTAGPAFPMGSFASTDVNKEDAGMAKTGFTIDLVYGRSIDKVFGLMANVGYVRHNVDQTMANSLSEFINPAAMSFKPWEAYTAMLGPSVTTAITPKTSFDFGFLSGAVMVKSPGFDYQDAQMKLSMKADWATAVPLKGIANLRFQVAPKTVMAVGISYLYMKPSFNTTVTGEQTIPNPNSEVGTITQTVQKDASFQQKINTFGVHAGIGLTF